MSGALPLSEVVVGLTSLLANSEDHRLEEKHKKALRRARALVEEVDDGLRHVPEVVGARSVVHFVELLGGEITSFRAGVESPELADPKAVPVRLCFTVDREQIANRKVFG
ncbi:MAG: hypothetical protein OXH75_15575 [Acidobacteria bacterium]|nr:hypothetical protein [Acidobacteriota bacterium]